MLRPLAAFAGIFVGVVVILLAAVGQLGKIDGRTLVAVLVAAAVFGGVVAWRSRSSRTP